MAYDLYGKIPDVYEKDVWYFSSKFNLNRTTFRTLFTSKVLSGKLHSLNYSECSAQDLISILESAYSDMQTLPADVVSESYPFPPSILIRCINRLKKLQTT